MDWSFPREMANLSPPINESTALHLYERPADPPAGRSLLQGSAKPARTTLVQARTRDPQKLSNDVLKDDLVDDLGQLSEVSAFLYDVAIRHVAIHDAVPEPPSTRAFGVEPDHILGLALEVA